MIGEIIERLRGVVMPPFALVEGAAELASLGNGAPTATPAAYVFAAEEAAGENPLANAVRQRVELDVSVVVVTANVSDFRGEAASADIETLKLALHAVLLGWQPASADDVLTYVGGKMVRARDGHVWWELTFAAAFYLRA